MRGGDRCANTCVVNQDVQRVGPREYVGGQPLALVLTGQVGSHRADFAECRQRGNGVLARVGLTRTEHDVSASLEQTARDHHPDTAGAAGDQSGFTAQAEQALEIGCAHMFSLRSWFAFVSSEPYRVFLGQDPEVGVGHLG